MFSLDPDIAIAQGGNHNYNVLFIGNSYTYVNDLPGLTAMVAASVGDTLRYDYNTIGGYTLQMHSTNATTLSKINEGDWDYVVLQEQSQLPSFDLPQVDTEVFPYAKLLDSLVHKYNSCGRSMFYITWGRKYGDADNCPVWPPVCTYTGMDDLLTLRYSMMADSNHALLSPVGAVWRYLRSHYPSIDLYQSDASHPSEAGSYAAAVCFYTAIFKRNPMLINYDFSVPAADAATIRQVVKTVVYDTMSLWHINEYSPAAGFTFKAGTDNTVTFSNTSGNATSYEWYFGDGKTSYFRDASHIYSSGGTYQVVMVAYNCGKSDTATASIEVMPSGITRIYENTGYILFPNPVNNMLSIRSDLFTNNEHEICINNEMGQVVYKGSLTHAIQQHIPTNTLPPGNYFVIIFRNGVVASRNSFTKN